MSVPVEFLNGGNEDYVGTIPFFLSENNPKTAVEQLDDSYQHGGGWNNFNKDNSGHDKFALDSHFYLRYPGDPAYKPRARMQLRDETIYVYDSAWVVVLQKDGSFEVSRMD